jgi:branched-chain amino acid transport system substrate-binding protein
MALGAKCFRVLAAASMIMASAPAWACPAKIGAVLSLTGSYATFGPPISQAAQLAVEQLGQAGWHVGDCKQLDYLVRDDQTQPSVGVDAAQRLVNLDGVAAIVGPITSGVTGPILSSVTVGKNVLMVASASTSPGKTGGLFFRALPSDSLQAVAAAKMAIDAGFKKLAIIDLNNDWGSNLTKQFVATYVALGGTIASQVTYNAEQPSYRAEVTKALSSDPDSVYMVSSVIDGTKIMRDWLSLGGPQKFLFPQGVNDQTFVDQIGGDYLKDALFVAPGQSVPNSVKQFGDAYEQRWKMSAIGPGRDSGYDAGALIGLAMYAAKSYSDGKAIAAAIPRITDPAGALTYASVDDYKKAFALLDAGKPIRFVGATGAMQFDSFGDVATPFVGWGVDGKTFVERKSMSAEDVAAIKQKTGT